MSGMTPAGVPENKYHNSLDWLASSKAVVELKRLSAARELGLDECRKNAVVLALRSLGRANRTNTAVLLFCSDDVQEQRESKWR